MNKKQMDDIYAISNVFASPKRILLLKMLNQEPAGYMMIESWFERIGIPTGSSETYKNINILIKEGFIVRTRTGKYGKYIITKRGMVAIKKVKEIAGTEARVPKIRMEF